MSATQSWLGPNDVLNQMNVQAATRETLIPDIKGSILASLDSGTGTLAKQTYQSYGESGNATPPFAYRAQRLDIQSGLYYYRARMYSAALGRFLQPDPIGYAGGNNLYAYVNNDPTNATDPSGTCGPPRTGCAGGVNVIGDGGGIGDSLAMIVRLDDAIGSAISGLQALK